MLSRKSIIPTPVSMGGQPSFMQKMSRGLSFENFDWKTILILVIGFFAFVGIGYFLYNQFKPRTVYSVDNEEGMTVSSKTANLMFFYTDWCPHCRTAKPEWESLKSEYDGKVINGYTLVMTEYDGESKLPDVQELLDKYDVQGWPTIKLVKDNQVIDYDAKPSKDTLVQFLNTVL
jgi:thiol-disulfide isomerase/thioredoxin